MNKFLKLSTWKNIIESRWIYYQNRNKDWYKERKAICDVCPHNSKYHKKTIYERQHFKKKDYLLIFLSVCVLAEYVIFKYLLPI